MRKPKITREYADRRDRLEITFPHAHAFLRRLESEDRLWLSTATNAHVYSGGRFLAYIKIRAPELKPPSLLLSPRFNHRIAAETVDASSLLFPEVVDQLIAQHGTGWWFRREGGALELTYSTPGEFFEELAAGMAAV